jgi:hypothetical protein
VVAKVKARAFYQLAPRDKTQARPALNYVRGRVITIDLVNHQVSLVTVVDSAAGVYLEPQSDTVRRDSLRRARILADTVPKYLRKKKGKAGAAPDSGAPAPADSGSPPQAPARSTKPQSDSAHSSFSSLGTPWSVPFGREDGVMLSADTSMADPPRWQRLAAGGSS